MTSLSNEFLSSAQAARVATGQERAPFHTERIDADFLWRNEVDDDNIQAMTRHSKEFDMALTDTAVRQVKATNPHVHRKQKRQPVRRTTYA
ncbi:MAG: hypothetical protein LBF50_09810 [Azoarcus sp.]|jgi:hypothetical protein|nr:hypothetical protein [Azoarcus sp.]